MSVAIREADALADDLELIEMANLSSDKTGVPGVIYISTAQCNHGPRVKWYAGRPARQAPCLGVTIEAEPQSINHGLSPREFGAASQAVIAWVLLNHAALLAFWNDGHAWMDDEVTAFKAALRKAV